MKLPRSDLKIRLLQRGTQRVLVGKIAFEFAHRAIDQQRGVVGLERVSSRDGIVFFQICVDERLVLRIVQVRRPIGAAIHAKRGVFFCCKHRLVDRERRQERDLVGKTSLPELLDEVHAHAARHEGVNRFGTCRADLGDLGRVVELAERHIDFVEDFAVEFVLEARAASLPAR